jgi:hypothetical protein
MALLGVSPVQADTTYYYVGNPYTANSDPTNFGTNMTGSVTFDFDTSSATGVFYLSEGHITDLQLTSGIYSVDATNFTFNFPFLFPPILFLARASSPGGHFRLRILIRPWKAGPIASKFNALLHRPMEFLKG